MSDKFGDIFGGLFDGAKRPTDRQHGTDEKTAPTHVRVEEGTAYVRVEDVIALLEANDVLPKAVARFKALHERAGQ